MSTQIGTSTFTDATGTPADRAVRVVPSDNSVAVYYHDGAEPRLATAQSPYTTWAAQTIGGATPRHFGSLYVESNDGIDSVVCSPSSGAFYFHWARSGNTWTSDANWDINIGNTSGAAPAATSAFLDKDAQGRLWWVTMDSLLTEVVAAWSSAPTSSWTSSLTVTGITINYGCPLAAIIGNYLVVVYDVGNGNFTYRRADVSGVTVGAWSAAATITVGGDVTTSVQGALMGVPGGSTGVLVYSGANGIKSFGYNATTDTWDSSATTLSANASDRHPTLIAGATDTVYAVWMQFASANTYAIVSKTYSSGAWGASATTLETSANAGTNAAWPVGAYIATGAKLALMWTTGTASPYSVQFDAPNAPSGVTTLTRTIATTAALLATLTHGMNATGALLATLSRGINTTGALLGTATRSTAVHAALLATSVHGVTSTVTLLATATRNVPESVSLQSTLIRTLGGASAFSATNTRQVAMTVAVSAITPRGVGATVALAVSATRTLTTNTATLALVGALRSTTVSASFSGGATLRTAPLSGAIGVVIVASVPLTVEMPGEIFYIEMGGDM